MRCRPIYLLGYIGLTQQYLRSLLDRSIRWEGMEWYGKVHKSEMIIPL